MDKSSRISFRIVLAYLSVCIIWGSTYLAIRIGVEHLPPAIFAGLRFFFAGGAMLLYGKIKGSPLPPRRGIFHLSVVGIFLLVGGNLLVVWSEKSIPSGLAALIIAIVPLFMSSIDSFTPKGQSLSLLGWVGILIGFGGVFILVSPSIGLADGHSLNPLGIVGLIAASFLWSVGSVYSKHHHVEGDVFVNSGVQNLVPGILLIVISVLTNELPQAVFTQEGVLALLYLIVLGSIIGYTSYVYLLRHVAPAKASTYAYINPVVAIFLGWVILAEPIDARTIIAALVILGGVAIVQTSRMKS
ncbi:MAG: EamA family transporter [Ignavibacteriae bacterium]|nr:EamA family transporter [Ignavibacteriota bacterium]